MRKIKNFDHLDRRQPTEVEVHSPADVDALARRGIPLEQTMQKFLVTVGRNVHESAIIEVEARNADEAKSVALEVEIDSWETETIKDAFVMDCEYVVGPTPERSSDAWKQFVANAINKPSNHRSKSEQDEINYLLTNGEV